jgi:integron integrase
MSHPQEPAPTGRKLMDQVRDRIRIKHYAKSTEKTYVYWILQYINFHNKRHPARMGKPEIEDYLSHLAQKRRLSPSSQNQAFNAILFLYREVLCIQLSESINAVRAKRHKRIPVVLSVDEARRVIGGMSGAFRLMAELLYGSGLRIGECLSLRIQDVDFGRKTVMIRSGKGKKDRLCVLPNAVQARLQEHVKKVSIVHQEDVRRGFGAAALPCALHRKYPAASREFRWQFLFPQARLYTNPKTGDRGRWHVDESLLRKAVKRSAVQAGVVKRATPHCFRHSYATHLLEAGYNIRAVQELMGHKSIETTMIYTHVMDKGVNTVKSPLDIF